MLHLQFKKEHVIKTLKHITPVANNSTPQFGFKDRNDTINELFVAFQQ